MPDFVRKHMPQVVVTCGLLAGEAVSLYWPEARSIALPLTVATNMLWVWWVD